jgi:hypothetical protein
MPYRSGEDLIRASKSTCEENGQIPLLTPEQEIGIGCKDPSAAIMKARALMIPVKSRLVVKIAHGLANLGLPLLDLISEGNIGLKKAVERYRPKRRVESIPPTRHGGSSRSDRTRPGKTVEDDSASDARVDKISNDAPRGGCR